MAAAKPAPKRTTKPAPTAPSANAVGEYCSRRVENFFHNFLRHTKGRWAGQSFELEPWQRDEIVRPLFGTLNRRGLRQYRTGLVGIPRKNGKSELCSGLALFGLVADGYVDAKTGAWKQEFGAEVYSLAGSKDQARIVFGQAKQMVAASPFLRASIKVYRDALEVPETSSVYRVLSADSRLAHGYNPSMAVVDELHVHRNGELYEAIISGTAARQQPLVIAITTAGWDRTSIAHRLYEAGQAGKDRRQFFRWWEPPKNLDLQDTKGWRAANPASWVSIDFIRSQRDTAGMPEAVWRRLHLNQWTGHAQRWIPVDLWDACDAKADIPAGSEVWIGVDAAPKRDTTAVVIVRRDDAGMIHARAHVFSAEESTGYLNFAAVEELLRELCKLYDVRRILVDPYVMTRTLLELLSEGLPVEEYPQGDARMVPASQTLFDLVVENRLRHGGDRTLRDQADAAAVKETPRGWRLDKRKSSLPIDSVVALAIAAHTCEQDSNRDNDGIGGIRFL